MTFQPPQWLFWALLILGLAIAIMLAYHEVRMQKVSLRKQLGDKTQRKETREQLGKFLERGQALQSKCATQDDSPKDECQNWADEVEAFLGTNLDNSYVSRFRSSAGVPLTAMVNTVKHPDFWKSIHIRNFQLSKFLEELGY